MQSPITVQALSQIALFQGVPPADLAQIAAAAHTRRAAPDAFFFQQGEPADMLFVLGDGRVRMTQLAQTGQQVLLRFIGPGEMFGGIAAMGDKVYPASAQAVDAALAYGWASDTIAHWLEHAPRLAFNALQMMVGRVHDLQDRYRELATERVERRVARAILRLARQSGVRTEEGLLIDLPLSRSSLAELTGTTLFTVSRILSQWEQQGWIHSGRERILLLQAHRLVIVAEDLPPIQPPSK